MVHKMRGIVRMIIQSKKGQKNYNNHSFFLQQTLQQTPQQTLQTHKFDTLYHFCQIILINRPVHLIVLHLQIGLRAVLMNITLVEHCFLLIGQLVWKLGWIFRKNYFDKKFPQTIYNLKNRNWRVNYHKNTSPHPGTCQDQKDETKTPFWCEG